jgi:putative peptide zinc metalloprotease protein
MSAIKDLRIRELGQMLLTVRRDLVFTPDRRRDATQYQIEDPLSGKFYRLGLVEYTFVSLLDGKTTVAEALRRTVTVHADTPFSEADAASLSKWLIETGLASTSESLATARLARSARDKHEQRLWKRFNPVVFRWALLQPDALLEALLPLFGWLYTRVGLVLAGLLFAAAAFQLTSQHERLFDSSRGILAADNWFWLACTWLLLKVWHELGHALACKRFGGAVREFGVMFVLAAPIAYVDVTSSWRFRSKWQRIFTAAAGMYHELLVAAVAALVWSNTHDGVVAHVCYGIMLMASVTTVLVNANPLMRFDGYYILSDWLEIPNLQPQGRAFLQYIARRWLLGVSAARPAWSSRRAVWIRGYAVAALAWRIFVCATLLVVTSVLFHGAGLLLSLAAGAIWIGLPVFRFVRYLLYGTAVEQPNRLRFALLAGSAALAVSLVLAAPWPGAERAHGVVEYAPLTVVRADSAGFYRELRIRDGQRVERGDLLAVLDNPELDNELADLELKLAQAQIKSRRLERDGRLAEYQAELEAIHALEKQREEKQAQVRGLQVRAPVSGVVVSRGLDALAGSYVRQGDPILAIGNERGKELQISVAQDEIDRFAAAVGQPLRMRFTGEGTTTAVLARLSPKASTRCPHLALCAPSGGPLAVRSVKQAAPSGEFADRTDNAERFELVEPSFEGSVALTAAQAQRYRAGRLAVVSLGSGDSVAFHLYRITSNWVRDLLRHCSQSTSRAN